ncbi:MAG: hypothetical protein WC635_11825 [Bacteriovorax sp.]|jgi:hypothetical protein
MKILITIFFILAASSTRASHNQLWVGFKKKDVSTVKFINGLNNSFFKETIGIGKGKGLLAYQPYITNMNGEVPDGVVLITYENEERYNAIKSSPEGERYGKSHWDYFDKETSIRIAAQLYQGALTEDAAFELAPAFHDWQKGTTHVAIYARNPDFEFIKTAEAFNDLKKRKEVNNSVLLITKKWIIEYRSLKKKHSKFISLPLKLLELKRLPSSSLENMKEPVGFADGINVLF